MTAMYIRISHRMDEAYGCVYNNVDEDHLRVLEELRFCEHRRRIIDDKPLVFSVVAGNIKSLFHLANYHCKQVS